MDSRDDAASYDAMDHTQVNTRFVDDLLATGHELRDVLDLGTGTALIPIELCRRESECRVMAGDLAISMLELARYNLEITMLTHRVQLIQIDAKQTPFATGMFHTTISNSILHHIPQPRDVLAESLRITAAGGLLFFRDLARPNSLDELDGLVATYAADADDHARQLFRDSLHAALTIDEIRALVAEFGFDRDTVQMTSDRHWTWCARKPESA